MRPTPTEACPETQDLDRQIKAYLAKGGKITHCPPCMSAESMKDGDWRKNKNSFTINRR